MILEFFVPGIARPGGSKRIFRNPKTGQAIVTKAGGKNEEYWRQMVAFTALQAVGTSPPLVGPVCLDVTFILPRPKYHFHTGKKLAGQLKTDAPAFHDRQPDRTKLLRSTEDALKGILWLDDGQVCMGTICKVYGERPGAKVRVSQVHTVALQAQGKDKDND